MSVNIMQYCNHKHKNSCAAACTAACAACAIACAAACTTACAAAAGSGKGSACPFLYQLMAVECVCMHACCCYGDD